MHITRDDIYIYIYIYIYNITFLVKCIIYASVGRMIRSPKAINEIKLPNNNNTIKYVKKLYLNLFS
jgi:hypothetical protein